MMINRAFFLISLLLVFILTNICTAEETKKEIDVVGKQDFVTYCGSCHGTDGKGDGPIVNFIKRKPPDLTQLSKNNNGTFPFDRIWGVFDGTYIFAEHGTSEMPIWGYRFIQEAQQKHETDISTKAKAKALNIVLYLQVIQE
jgi:mono/diheme cytochrome c family protein